MNKHIETCDETHSLLIYKYQPVLFRDFVLNNDIIVLLNTLIDMNNLNILFVGNAGGGKTSLINALIARYYNTGYVPKEEIDVIDKYPIQPRHYSENVLYINSLKEQGVNFCRNEVKTFCQTMSSIKNKKKVIVLDDIDAVNEQSQQVFRNCVDKYSDNVHFIASCSNTQKVIESIQSRLMIVKIDPFGKQDLRRILTRIKTKEHIFIERNVEDFIINICNYMVKPLINYMEKFKLIGAPITLELAMDVCTKINFVSFENYTQFVKTSQLREAICVLYNMYDDGYSVMDILDNYSLFVKTTDSLSEHDKYAIISCICKYITVFHNTHEEPIELALFTNNIAAMCKSGATE